VVTKKEKVLVTSIGPLKSYKSAKYIFNGESVELDHPLEALERFLKPSKMVVISTRDAIESNKGVLAKLNVELIEVDSKDIIRQVDVLKEVFLKNEGSEIVINVTFGYRSIPISFLVFSVPFVGSAINSICYLRLVKQDVYELEDITDKSKGFFDFGNLPSAIKNLDFEFIRDLRLRVEREKTLFGGSVVLSLQKLEEFVKCAKFNNLPKLFVSLSELMKSLYEEKDSFVRILRPIVAKGLPKGTLMEYMSWLVNCKQYSQAYVVFREVSLLLMAKELRKQNVKFSGYPLGDSPKSWYALASFVVGKEDPKNFSGRLQEAYKIFDHSRQLRNKISHGWISRGEENKNVVRDARKILAKFKNYNDSFLTGNFRQEVLESLIQELP